MAIYLKLSDIETDLRQVAERLPEYEQNQDFMSGYDSATDVMTCANTGTIWHGFHDSEKPLGRVLVAEQTTHAVRVAYWIGEAWHIEGGGVLDENAVLAWAELPDWPVDL